MSIPERCPVFSPDSLSPAEVLAVLDRGIRDGIIGAGQIVDAAQRIAYSDDDDPLEPRRSPLMRALRTFAQQPCIAVAAAHLTGDDREAWLHITTRCLPARVARSAPTGGARPPRASRAWQTNR